MMKFPTRPFHPFENDEITELSKLFLVGTQPIKPQDFSKKKQLNVTNRGTPLPTDVLAPIHPSKRPLNYAELSIQQDLEQGTTDIFDEYLAKEFGALEIEIPTSGNQLSRIIPFFQSEDLLRLDLPTPPPPTTSAPTQPVTKPQTTTAPTPSTTKIQTPATTKTTPTPTTIKTPIITIPRPTTTTTVTPTPTTKIVYITEISPILSTTPTPSPPTTTTLNPPTTPVTLTPVVTSTPTSLSRTVISSTTTTPRSTTLAPFTKPLITKDLNQQPPKQPILPSNYVIISEGFPDFYEDFPHYSTLIPRKPLVMVEKSTSKARKDSPPYNSELENRIAHSITFASANI
ncbi:hypothetical protein Y032_0001g232 [Ancylostoma ceylanicum]|uniref:Uncharacterized protein n=1 Tax=Ancylostoma ceylanicum TaxID=53326 RepID=A0A016W484_9BILA|nr:hypothetical protein Y032_0001g232 [Ancylostoma ceylanicum]